MNSTVTSCSCVAPCCIFIPSGNQTKLPGSKEPWCVTRVPSRTYMPWAQGWVCQVLVKPAGYFTIRTVMPVSGSSRKRLANSALPISGMKRSSQGMAPESNTCSVSFASIIAPEQSLRTGPGPRQNDRSGLSHCQISAVIQSYGLGSSFQRGFHDSLSSKKNGQGRLQGEAMRFAIAAMFVLGLSIPAEAEEINLLSPPMVTNAGLKEINARYTGKTGVTFKMAGTEITKLADAIKTTNPPPDIVFMPTDMMASLEASGGVRP